MAERVWVIVPTYNEIENLEPFVEAVSDQLTRLIPGDHRILIVDDDSPDGTGQLADSLSERINSVEVLHRPDKDGLGRAYLAGFAHAMSAGAELLVQMDADFSHDPKFLEAMLSAAQGADLVLGSRYVTGGAVVNWGLLRRAISRGGSAYARAVLRVRVQDLTGGYKCIRRTVLETIDLSTLRAAGYVFQIEVTYRAICAGFRIAEVPIVFVDRKIGNSKMSWRIAAEAMLLVPSLRRSSRSPRPEPLLRA